MTSDKPRVELGAELLALRTKKGWSLRRAAEEIGSIGHNRLRDFERGEDPHSGAATRPTEDQVIKMARAYGVPPRRLLRIAGCSREEWMAGIGRVS